LRHGLNSPALDGLAFLMDDLIRAASRPARPVSEAQRAVLLRQVSQGLADADLPRGRADAELADLQALLLSPPVVEEDHSGGPADTMPGHAAQDLQGGLPTVPVVPIGTDFDSMLEVASHRPWLDELQPGAYCRMFLLGRWMTAQLSWISATRNLYMFTSRHGCRTHSLTRRMLSKLRNAGLVTSIEDGFLLAQAMDTLAQSDLSEN
jgi:hypothetical protein